MWLQCLAPRMQDAEKPDFHSEALCIGADFEHGCGAGFKQEMEQRPLVLPDERHQFIAGHRADCVESARNLEFLPANPDR